MQLKVKSSLVFAFGVLLAGVGFTFVTVDVSAQTSAVSTESAALAQEEVIPQENLVYLYSDTGLVVIELLDSIAPKHVQRFTSLVNEGFYDGLDFYRVIDGFVAQGGDLSEKKASKFTTQIEAEFTRSLNQDSDFITVQSPGLLAQQTGFIQGAPAGRSVPDRQEWLLHCPGAVAMARNNDANSATSDFYIVIGHAPRHLDRNMSVFAQVIYGMENVQAMRRGDPNVDGGVIEEPAKRSKIIQAKRGSKVEKAKQLTFSRQLVSSDAFQARLQSARTLENDFFHYKGSGNIDVCYYRPRAQLK